MPKTAEETRRRILESGYALFYRHGFNRVGVDEIARAARVTKRTLYYHFRSKDELLASVLERQHALALAQVRNWAERLSGGTSDVFDSLFEDLAKWAAKPRYAGAGFTRIVMELADLPGHPARLVARRHKAAIEDLVAEVLAKTGVKNSAERARETVVLLEGAMVLLLVHGDHSYASAAARAAKRLNDR
ncbi:MAG: helix-turn-helix domain-containing protein [Xanthobacteraceae bacterium]